MAKFSKLRCREDVQPSVNVEQWGTLICLTNFTKKKN